MLCAICLESLYAKEKNAKGAAFHTHKAYLTSCNHVFHKKCYFYYEQTCLPKGETVPCPVCKEGQEPQLLEKMFLKPKLSTLERAVIGAIDWSKNDTFICGGFAAALLQKRTVPFGDVNIFTANVNSVHSFAFLKLGLSDVQMVTSQSPDRRPCLDCISNTFSFKKSDETQSSFYGVPDVTVAELAHVYHDFDIEEVMHDVMSRFDLSCSKVACRWVSGDGLVFYVHPDFYSEAYTVCHGYETCTEARVAKYRERGWTLNAQRDCVRCRVPAGSKEPHRVMCRLCRNDLSALYTGGAASAPMHYCSGCRLVFY